jgi:hypothetical protein
MLLVSLPNFITSFWVIADIIFLKINRFSRTIIDNFRPQWEKIIRETIPTLFKLHSRLTASCNRLN